MRTLLAAITLTAALAPRAARADGASSGKRVALEYSRGAGSEQCADEAQLRDDVGARLGYAPFDDASPTKLRVRLSREGATLRAAVELIDARGAVTGSRELSSTSCEELESATSLTMAMVIDPLGADAEPSTATAPALPPAAAPVAPPPTAPSVAASVIPAARDATLGAPPSDRPEVAPSSTRLRVGLSGVAGLGYAPAVGYGATLGVGIGLRSFSIDLEGRRDLPVTAVLGRGEATTSLLLANVVPCLHRGILSACGVASLGSMQSLGGRVASPSSRSALFVAVGARAGVEWPLSGSFALAARGEVLAPLIHTTLRLDGEDVWATPVLAGSLGVGLVAFF